MTYIPLFKVVTDGNGHFLRMDYCICPRLQMPMSESAAPENPLEGLDPVCPLYDNHVALAKRQPLPGPLTRSERGDENRLPKSDEPGVTATAPSVSSPPRSSS